MSAFVRTAKHPSKDLFLQCYTKKAFYKKKWDKQTINARGHVYDGEGNLISAPFEKFFNLNEHHSTLSRIWEDRVCERPDTFYIYPKLNGHLAILFYDGEEWINTTKGSFENEFIPRDRELIEECGFDIEALNDMPKNFTFMFEIIGDHDPHLLTETHKELRGGECAVLIGINSIDCQDDSYEPLSHEQSNAFVDGYDILHSLFDNPVPTTVLEYLNMHTVETLNTRMIFDHLKTHESVEGYIIYDSVLKKRVKVKTDWFMRERYKFQFNESRVRNIFTKFGGSEQAYAKIPEEFHEKYDRVIMDFLIYELKTKNSLISGYGNLALMFKTRNEIEIMIDTLDLTEKEKKNLKDIGRGRCIDSEIQLEFAECYENFSFV